eukprot:scaffold250610_cov30-Tisochrysis_lutea.AAC.16
MSTLGRHRYSLRVYRTPALGLISHSTGRYCSRTVCAMVPEYPKELTPPIAVPSHTAGILGSIAYCTCSITPHSLSVSSRCGLRVRS